MSVDTDPLPQAVTPSSSGFGSAPVFDARRGTIVWVGVDGQTVNEVDAASASPADRPARAVLRQWEIPPSASAIGVFPRRRADGYALVTRGGFGYVSQGEVFLTEVLPVSEGRLAVAQVDPRGRLWAVSEGGSAGAGSSSGSAGGSGSGRLRRWDGTEDSIGASRGFDRPTGVGWSPDGSTMYLLDAGTRSLYAARFLMDEGVVGEFALAAALDLPGDPAGLAVDADGFLWFGVRSAGQVRRIDPSGSLIGTVDIDASSPSGLAFDATGGLYVTADVAVTAAAVHRIEASVPGVRVAPFAA